MLSLGVDIGGTFTDIVAFDPASGHAFAWKESTTPDDPARGVIAGVRHLLDHHHIDPAAIVRTVHATTLFTNALIERRGAATGLITTAGFRDVLEIARERKYELYDLFIRMPRPLVPREWRREVRERMAPDGRVEVSLDTDQVLHEAAFLVAEGVTSLAVVFLHAYANPVHEQQAAQAIANKFPGLSISLSSDVAPEIREYPRASTTVANAYVQPIAEAYLQHLAGQLAALGIARGFYLMLSNGGLTHLAEARRAPVQLLESGPAAGALAGAWFGRAAGADRVLAFDMGGTTAKLALVDDGQPMVTFGFEAAREKRFLRGSGLPIQIPTIELIEIGAGGGSIARKSPLGTLNVGPQSAGAQPGPACYGRGGHEPTVTDADLVLGYLDADFFLGGAMRIDAPAARHAIDRLAADLAVEPMAAAFGIHDVVAENMAAAARVAIAEHGRIPSEYALLATGGAAPVHAWHVARKLGIGRLLSPPGAGVGSAIGMLMAPARCDLVSSLIIPLHDADFAAIGARFRQLEIQAMATLAGTGADFARRECRAMADMRYVGQGAEITINLPNTLDTPSLRAAFELTYQTLYGRTPPGAAIQFVALRLSLTAPMPGTRTPLTMAAAPATSPRKGTRDVWFAEAGGFVSTAVYDRYAIAAGTIIAGPAVFEERESTLVIGPGGRAVLLPGGILAIDIPP
jgi:N-methylhydantoinase A